MNTDKIIIKHMVCDRCIHAVSRIVADLDLLVEEVGLGYAIIRGLTEEKKTSLANLLSADGFELLNEQAKQWVNQIKSIVIREVHHSNKKDARLFNLSTTVERELGRNYSYLSHLFSQTEGRTIENYVILQRIERAKELLKYGDLTVRQIAFELGYSSPQYLIAQFKQVTGMTPGKFKGLASVQRKSLDQL